MAQEPPLTGVRVLEFAGLAPGPYAGLLLAEYGATVLRVDRAHPRAHTSKPPSPTSDQLTRHKSSISVNTKSAAGIALIKALIPHVDVVIDPFRPGVLEKMGLGPDEVLLTLNPRLIVGRMTGFRRDGKYKDMAGHDINYIAVSGVLSMLGRKGDRPQPPANILGDFAGGGAVCFMGILLALFNREKTGRGQVVEANMVDGASHLATFPRLNTKTPSWNQERGANLLDGGCPYYDTYETKDGRYMAVGALEPQFFVEFVKGLGFQSTQWAETRYDRDTWPELRGIFTKTFKSKTRDEWEQIFDGTDACCTPIFTQAELEKAGHDQRPIVTLKASPAFAITQGPAEGRTPAEGQGSGVEGSGWATTGLRPGVGGEQVLSHWMGWRKGREYDVVEGGLQRLGDERSKRSKL